MSSLDCVEGLGLYLCSLRCGCKDMVRRSRSPPTRALNSMTSKQVAFVPFGDQSKRQRKLMHRALGAESILRYRPLIETETKSFMRRLLDDPSDYIEITRRYAVGLICRAVYAHFIAFVAQIRWRPDTFRDLRS